MARFSTMNETFDWVDQMNRLGSDRIPFLFVIDFEGIQAQVWPISELPDHIRFSTPGKPHGLSASALVTPASLRMHPMEFSDYLRAFQIVQAHLHHGNSYLVNLTFPTNLEGPMDLEAIFESSRAPFRLWFRDRFVVFSPEPFISIRDGIIRSFPMKGTIDATLPQAREVILSDLKETAEHATIVDLLRNDLSRVADHVRVERFRYVEQIQTNQKDILQVSSEIAGNLDPAWFRHTGDLMQKLLPAGSVSGAPKPSTLKIIRQAEGTPRGFYTGVFGICDGDTLESAVMIRYIEKNGDGYRFRSGGGITHLSDPMAEYQEMLAKVYLTR